MLSFFVSPAFLSFLSLSLPLLFLLKKHFNGPLCHYSPNLSSKIIIITGANSGIGRYAAEVLAKLGATIILACRNLQKANKTKESIQRRTGNNKIEVIPLDLADFASIRLFVKTFKEKYNKLDILLNNAGNINYSDNNLTKDGFEIEFGSNHLGHFLLTNLLLPTLKNAAPSRVVNVSSLAYKSGKNEYKEIRAEHYHGVNYAYSRSKLANILFTRQLAKNLEAEKIEVKVVALHPGVILTGLNQKMEERYWWVRLLVFILRPLIYVIFKDVRHGAQTSLHCALVEHENLVNGGFYADCQVKETLPHARDEQAMKELWELSVQATKLT